MFSNRILQGCEVQKPERLVFDQDDPQNHLISEHLNSNTNSNTNRHTYSNADSNTYSNADSNADADTNSDTCRSRNYTPHVYY